ncbi:unnamed protein product [Pedinophyceae sp. YPF-701]|nr:unnamed protein product [Pedinophyceae sp. YPF-701]
MATRGEAAPRAQVPGRPQNANRSAGLTGAAGQSYSLVYKWEHEARLSDDQVHALAVLAGHTAERPLPDHVLHEVTSPRAGAATQEGAKVREDRPDAPAGPSVEELERAVLHNGREFRKWHAQVEAVRAHEREGRFRDHATALASRLADCDEVLSQIDAVLSVLDTVHAEAKGVAARTAALHDGCERLAQEKDALEAYADRLTESLEFFAEADRVQDLLSGPGAMSAETDQFMATLERLDKSIEFVSSHPRFRESASYQTRFRQLRSRALYSLRTRAVAALKSACEQSASADAAPGAPGGDQHTAATIRFRAIAEPTLCPLIATIEARAGADPDHAQANGVRFGAPTATSATAEYRRLLEDLRNAYCDARARVALPPLRGKVNSVPIAPLPAFLRGAAAHLLRACEAETSLMAHIFPASARADPRGWPSPLVSNLADALSDILLPSVIATRDIPVLCDTIDVLQREILEGDLPARGGAVAAALEGPLTSMLGDVRERLIYCIESALSSTVQGFRPTDADLDYPACLERRARDAGAAGWADAGMGESEAWYPPLASAVTLLGQMNGRLAPRVFSGMASEAVRSCTAALESASRAVSSKAGSMEGLLFLVRHLLVLKSHVQSFQGDFEDTEIELDFSHMRDQLRRIMGGEASLFAFSSSNPALQLLSEGPNVRDATRDARRQLDQALRSACESLIGACMKTAVEPLVTFITKVTSVRVSGAAADAPLREMAFASVDRIVEIVTRVNEAMENALPQAVQRMSLYLGRTSEARQALLRPIWSNVAEAHGQIAALLEAEYTPEEVAAVPLKSPDDLQRLLETLDSA